ncbi:MAG: NAD-binding protein [Anaerolineae bacterium]|nr:NAD-binding protein [Anaerolineae bacterium]MDW8299039.1 NAD-binding protein [Anaerolineae bacterium]
MKFLLAQLLYLLRERPNRMNLVILARFLLTLIILITIYSILFHYIMEYEGRYYSWVTGFYWTLTVMTTLGFGDITFQSDLGKLFSMVVLLSGVFFLLVLLPFIFVEFFYAPWIRAQQAARAPRQLPKKMSGHVIITHLDNVTRALIEKLKQYQYPYVLLINDLSALASHDAEYRVMIGALDNPKTYQLARVDKALIVVTTGNDQLNANVAATVREVCEHVPILATANFEASVDILELAGCNHVLQLGEMMGQAIARRAVGDEPHGYPIGQFGELLIVETTVRETQLVGHTLRELALREQVGVNVLGLWQRGVFHAAQPEALITESTILVMAGTQAQIGAFRQRFHKPQPIHAPIVIIGAGRVGRAAARALAERGLDYRIVEKAPERIRDPQKYILGDAAELEVLERAGIRETTVVIITTHDDDLNIYLTIYCRRLRPEAQIISRANLERNVATLHRAGADFVLSYASMGANAIINVIGRDNILMVAEGLDIFEVEIPRELAGRSITECDIRNRTGCTLVGVRQNGTVSTVSDPTERLPSQGRIILIGDSAAEKRFLKLYKHNGKR